MPKPARIDVGRLALRQEGEFWNAYHSPIGTMEGALLLGSIRMSIVTKSPKAKQGFMDTMRDAMTQAISETVGQKPSWDEPQTAPEHERSGHG